MIATANINTNTITYLNFQASSIPNWKLNLISSLHNHHTITSPTLTQPPLQPRPSPLTPAAPHHQHHHNSTTKHQHTTITPLPLLPSPPLSTVFSSTPLTCEFLPRFVFPMCHCYLFDLGSRLKGLETLTCTFCVHTVRTGSTQIDSACH